tara:strand:- start:3755 stop:3994 length:240 start_codon:yes stop_codon:yes gene_type:complete
MYHQLNVNDNNMKNLGFIFGFNYNPSGEKEVTKISNFYKIGDDIIEDNVYLKLYNNIEIKPNKFSRKNKKNLHKKSRKK